jgi:hypothetical protein
LCSCAVRRDLADVLGVLADVAMVSSPLVGRGYHSASIVGNQSTGRVSLPGQRCQLINRSSFSPGTWNCRCGLPNKTPKLVFASHDTTHATQRLRPGSPKKAAGYQSRPWCCCFHVLAKSVATSRVALVESRRAPDAPLKETLKVHKFVVISCKNKTAYCGIVPVPES